MLVGGPVIIPLAQRCFLDISQLLKMMASLLSVLGPAAPGSQPAELQLKAGDQIVAMGDSITQAGGYLNDSNDLLAAQYPDLKLPKIINVGISGQKAEDMVARFQKDVVDKKPQWVTISVGINDVWHRVGKPHEDEVLQKFGENLTKMVDMAQAAGAKVILLSPTVITENPDDEGNKRLKLYVGLGKKIAAEKKCQYVDLHAMFLEVLSKKPAGEAPLYVTSDGVHMNSRGNALMALGVLRALGVPDEKMTAAK